MWALLAKFGAWVLGKFFAKPTRQPDAEAQDDRATAVEQAARAETHLQDQQAAVAASGAENATVTKADADAAAVQRVGVSNPASVDADPEGHWRD